MKLISDFSQIAVGDDSLFRRSGRLKGLTITEFISVRTWLDRQGVQHIQLHKEQKLTVEIIFTTHPQKN
jgi:hypothetical protein